jgi:hypothetical protein
MYSLLVKFAKEKEHIEQFQEGLFYCKPIKYFTELEDGKVRGDIYESVIELHYIEKGTLQLKPAKDEKAEWKTFDIINAQFKKNYPNPFGNLFCMSSITVSPTKEPIIFEFDEKFKSFGNYAVLIMNQPVFLERLKQEAERQKIKLCLGKVEYLDLSKFGGQKSLFQKDIDYSWQEEFRIFVDRDANDLFTFSIGSIKDISMIVDLNKQKQFWMKIP